MNPGTAPVIGRTVHFHVDAAAAAKLNQIGKRRYNVGDKCAGVITHPLDNSAVNLSLFVDGADELMPLPNVPYSAGSQPGTWTYPEAIGEAGRVAA